MTGTRVLVVNADDFGYSPGVNRAIIRAHARGIVTSTSLMVLHCASKDAVAMSRDYPDLSLGLHLDLGEWAFESGGWNALYEVVNTTDASSVTAELDRQLTIFRDLVGRGPSHIDSHQHVHLWPLVKPIVARRARDLRIPLQHCTPGITYCGKFYGQTTEGAAVPNAVSPEALARLVWELGQGVTELVCHPGEGDDRNTMYRSERRTELEALCHPSVADTIRIQGIELLSFAALTARCPSRYVPEHAKSSIVERTVGA